MKILQTCPLFPSTPTNLASGVTQVVYNISKELVKRGHRVEVYTSGALQNGPHRKTENKSKQVLVDGIRVYYFPYSMHYYTFFVTPTIISTAKRSLREHDLIHIHDFRTFQGIVIAHYAKRFRLPYVVQAHGTMGTRPNAKLLRDLPKWVLDSTSTLRSLKNASKAIAVNSIEAYQYRNLGISKEKIEIVPNGIDFSKYATLPSKGCFKRKFGIDEDRKVILYLGRIHKIKGIDFLVWAYAHLIRDLGLSGPVLAIAGPDDGYLGAIQALISDLGLKDNILIPGPLYGVDKLEAYVDAEVCVLPSRQDSFPITVLEAYACGKPVVASRVEGLKNLVLDNVTGLLFDPGDIFQLTKCLLDLLNHGERALEAGLRGKSFAEENFSIKNAVDKLERVYEKVRSN
jgi:glycosyltransferase involved in cell wall biosynthesis